jgi:hypothetical protein
MTAERKPFDREAHERAVHLRHWGELIAKRDDPDQLRVYGKAYTIGPEANLPYYMKGHAGAWFGIRFNDGREVETTNLWFRGDVPEEYKEDLPDNAVFFDRKGRELDKNDHPVGEPLFSELQKRGMEYVMGRPDERPFWSPIRTSYRLTKTKSSTPKT